jgi:DNA-binding IclR family transcriptional regulator
MTTEGILGWRQDTRRYDWGPVWFQLTGSMTRSDEMRRLALPILAKVMQTCNETALLVRYDRANRKVTITDQVECAQPVRYHPTLGVPLPAHAGASGKVVLAFLPGAEVDRIIAAGLEPVTPRTITEPSRLRRDLAEIRKRGYCVSHGERTLGAVGLGCPIFDGNSNVMGALMVTIPEYRFSRLLESRVIAVLREGAERLSRLLGMPQDLDYPSQSRREPSLRTGGGQRARAFRA